MTELRTLMKNIAVSFKSQDIIFRFVCPVLRRIDGIYDDKMSNELEPFGGEHQNRLEENLKVK